MITGFPYAIALVLGLFVAVVCVGLLVHRIVRNRRRSAHVSQVERATRLLASVIVTGKDLDFAVDDARRRIGDRAVEEVLRRSRIYLRGPCTERLSDELKRMSDADRKS